MEAPDAVVLAWQAAAPEFRVFRKLVSDRDWVQLGTSTKPSYLDGTIEYGRTYQYYVQSIEKTEDTWAESETSAVVTSKPIDKFAPAVPVGPFGPIRPVGSPTHCPLSLMTGLPSIDTVVGWMSPRTSPASIRAIGHCPSYRFRPLTGEVTS